MFVLRRKVAREGWRGKAQGVHAAVSAIAAAPYPSRQAGTPHASAPRMRIEAPGLQLHHPCPVVLADDDHPGEVEEETVLDDAGDVDEFGGGELGLG